LGESRTKSVVRRRRDVREITGKRENKMELGEITGKREKIEVGESRTKSAVRRPRRKRDNWKEIK
jgi:hypothetical protein